MGLLEATVAALPSWTHMLTGYPVVRWPTFTEYIRSCVNILATECHLHELICQLQLMGQVGDSVQNMLVGMVMMMMMMMTIPAILHDEQH